MRGPILDNQLSILKKFSPECLYFDPFPHIVIENALDESVYSELFEDFPTREEFLRDKEEEPNRYYWIEAIRILTEYKNDRLWKKFVSYHTSQYFFDELIKCFENVINNYSIASAEFLRDVRGFSGVRFNETDLDILLDCQATYCSPVIGDPESPRGPHVDREVTAFSGLLYFRHVSNQTEGGDLILYRRKTDVSLTVGFDSSNHISPEYVEEAKRIAYQANTFVGFLNGPHAIHGVSPRKRSTFSRQHVNIIVESKNNVFDLQNQRPDKSGKTNSWYGNQDYQFNK